MVYPARDNPVPSLHLIHSTSNAPRSWSVGSVITEVSCKRFVIWGKPVVASRFQMKPTVYKLHQTISYFDQSWSGKEIFMIPQR